MPADPAAAAAPGDGAGAAMTDGAGGRPGLRRWWPAVRRVLTVGFMVLVAALLVNQARSIDWDAAFRAVRAYRPSTLVAAQALAAASYAIYCTFDLISRRRIGHTLATPPVLGVGFVAYAFSLNFGSLIGGVGSRFRLYSQLGLRPNTITEIVALSMLTNWIGYVLLAGAVFAFRPLQLPPDWRLGSTGLHLLGAALLLLVAAYLAVCFSSARSSWQVRGYTVKLPGGRMALLQLALSTLNWLIIAGVVYVLLGGEVDYVSVLSVMLIAAIAGVITHVPGNLGVLEAVFLALLSHRAGQHEILAALLAYRALYYLVPLALAALLFFVAEARSRRVSRTSDGAGSA